MIEDLKREGQLQDSIADTPNLVGSNESWVERETRRALSFSDPYLAGTAVSNELEKG